MDGFGLAITMDGLAYSSHTHHKGNNIMLTWKLPPKAKIYEALSAVADGRVRSAGPTKSEVTSSTGSKAYEVEWSEDFTKISSNDNASYWQGYLGYPIVAVLLSNGKLQYDQHVSEHLAGIEWKTLNKKFKNKYDDAIRSVLNSLAERGVQTSAITDEVDRIMEQLEKLELGFLPKRKRPPLE